MPASVVIDAAYVQSILPPILVWLYPYLPAMHRLEIGDVATFCSVDPPAFTVPSGPDLYAFLTGGPFGQAEAVQQFIGDLARTYLWNQMCQCNSVATPAPPTGPSAPSDLPGYNPPFVGVQPGACDTNSGFVTAAHHNTTEVTRDLLCGGGGGQPTCESLSQAIPSGARQFEIIASWATPTAAATTSPNPVTVVSLLLGHGTGFTTLDLNTPASIVTSGSAAIGPPMAKTSGRVTIPSASTLWIAEALTADATLRQDITVTINWYCDTGAIIGSQQCCTASDPNTQTRLNQILELVTLLQRQLAPFAYVSGTVHSGLSGTGTVAVQGILGALLNVSIPARAGTVVGTPDTSFDVGWINFGTSDGYTDRVQIRSDSQLVFPPAAGTWTIVGHTLLPGVTMTLTELVREP